MNRALHLSLVACHILFSAMNGMFIALVNILPFFENEQSI